MSEGKKFDSGKLRFDLIPPEAERLEAAVLTFGAQKYAPDNWRKVPEARRRYIAALRRHLNAWQRGEINDPETGLPHLAHARCCIGFLLELEALGQLDAPECFVPEYNNTEIVMVDLASCFGPIAPTPLANLEGVEHIEISDDE